MKDAFNRWKQVQLNWKTVRSSVTTAQPVASYVNGAKLWDIQLVNWKSTIRPCFSCTESRLSRKRLVVCVLASDWLEKKKKILRQLEEKHSSEVEEATLVDKNTGEIIIVPSLDDPHTDKNIVAEHDNHWQMKNREVFSTKIVEVLRLHKDVSISKPVADAITKEALSRIDRMSNETFMAHVSLRLQEALNDTGPVVVTVASNVHYGKKETREKKLKEKCLEG